MEGQETFNKEQVEKHLNVINDLFENVSEIFKDSNDYVNERVNTGVNSALFGNLANRLLEVWNQNAATFGDFKLNFEEWSKMISLIMTNNLQFEEETVSLYKNTGANLNGVNDKRASLLAAGMVSSALANGEKQNEYYDDQGNLVTITTNDQGKQYMKTIVDKDGHKQTFYYDDLGNYSVISVTNDGHSEIKYYDKDGKEIEKPYTFSTNGVAYNEEQLDKLADREVTAFIRRNGFDVTGEDYQKLSDKAKAIVDGTLQQINQLGVPDGSVEWQEKFKQLPEDAQQIVLNSIKGHISNDISEMNYSISNVIPRSNYDGKTIVVPELTENDFKAVQDEYALRVQNTQVIIDSANAVKTSLDGEAQGLYDIRNSLASNSGFLNLPPDQQNIVANYLDSEINKRVSAANLIAPDSSAGAQINSLGTGSSYDEYMNAVSAAQSWNEALANIQSAQKITAVLNSYGIFFR